MKLQAGACYWIGFQVAQLQGALLVSSPSVADDVVKVFNLPGVDKRKNFICLLINTNIIDISKLSTDQKRRFTPFLNFCPKVDGNIFMSIVEKGQLWNFFFESLPFIPVTMELLGSDVFTNHLFKLSHDVLVTVQTC